MREGAAEFIEKPFNDADLVARVSNAIVRDVHRHFDSDDEQIARQRFSALSPPECAVIEQLAARKTSREVAHALGLSPRTIDTHRGNLMRKMSAPTLAGLVRMVLLVKEKEIAHSKGDRIQPPKASRHASVLGNCTHY